MTINFAPNTLASTIGSIAVSGGVSTQIAVTATDDFAVSDPVFLDWKSGEVINQNKAGIASALVSGPSVEYLVGVGNGGMPSDGTTTSVSVLTLPDGSVLLLSAVKVGTQATPYSSVNLQKYTAKGRMLNRVHVKPIGNPTYSYASVCMTLLSNGNVCLAYYGGDSPFANYAIYTPDLRPVASGTLVASGVQTIHLQPTTNGGAIAFSTGGIYVIKADGTNSLVVSDSPGQMCIMDDENNNDAVSDDRGIGSLVKYAPVPISNGGFAYIYGTQQGVILARFNSDGTLRGAKQTLYATASNGIVKVAVSPATGNIMWAASVSGVYGVVSEAGVVVLVATGMANYAEAGGGSGDAVRLVADAAGNFLLFTFNYSAPNWFLRHMSPTGVVLFGSAAVQSIASPNGSGGTAGQRGIVSKLTTGTLLVSHNYGAGYVLRYVFVSLAGVITEGTIYNLAVTGQNSFLLRAFVLNDVLYGAATCGAGQASSETNDLLVFSIANVGGSMVVRAAPTKLGLPLQAQAANSINPALQMVVDPSGRSFYVVALQYSATSTAVINFKLDLQLNTVHSLPADLLTDCRWRPFGANLICYKFNGASPGNYYGGQITAAIMVKSRATVLLGVAAAAAAAGGPVVVNTKGVYAVSSAWKYAAQPFDQSASYPPGNAGSINNGFINLKGF